MHSTCFIYNDALLSYNFGSTHPFRPERISMCLNQLKSRNAIGTPTMPIIEPRAATRDEICSFHDSNYVSRIQEASMLGFGMLDSGDTPAFTGCYDASLAIAGATLTAIESVNSGTVDHSANFSGGLHHARKDQASGFCIFNDCAIGISALLKKYHRIAYIDIDAHHGDGIMYGYYDDPRVINIDIHQEGSTLFPGTGNLFEIGSGAGEGYKMNLPVPPHTADDSLLSLCTDLVIPMLCKTKPDFILIQCGADGLMDDPLAKLSYSERGCSRFVGLIHEVSHDLCSGRLVILGGGGYNPPAAASCWANEFLEVSSQSDSNSKEGFSISNISVRQHLQELKKMIVDIFNLG